MNEIKFTDIDAKDLNLSCRENHTVSICNECNEISKNSVQCLKCSSAKLKKKSLSLNRKCFIINLTLNIQILS